jgi:hypothetical protein
MAPGAQVSTRRDQRNGGFVVGGDYLVTVLAAHCHGRVDKLPLILGRMALEAGFSLKVLCFKIGMIRRFKVMGFRGIGRRKFAHPRHPKCRCDKKEQKSTTGAFR